jgi:protein-S-isoprenylcysteine O-methyltransferase Ste14
MDGKLALKALLIYLAGLIVVGAFLFIPAGTLDYWQAWLYMGVLFIPFTFVATYLLFTDPELIRRRLQTKEKEGKQRKIVSASTILFVMGFLLPGLDRRFGWSSIPLEVVIVANVLVFLGYVINALVLKENSYASRVVQVEKGQKVISTGPYSVVRHPMYFAVITMFLATPIALGSYWALLPFLTLPYFLILRIQNEEEVLKRELPGYTEYCQKIRYRLIPFVW